MQMVGGMSSGIRISEVLVWYNSSSDFAASSSLQKASPFSLLSFSLEGTNQVGFSFGVCPFTWMKSREISGRSSIVTTSFLSRVFFLWLLARKNWCLLEVWCWNYTSLSSLIGKLTTQVIEQIIKFIWLNASSVRCSIMLRET